MIWKLSVSSKIGRLKSRRWSWRKKDHLKDLRSYDDNDDGWWWRILCFREKGEKTYLIDFSGKTALHKVLHKDEPAKLRPKISRPKHKINQNRYDEPECISCYNIPFFQNSFWLQRWISLQTFYLCLSSFNYSFTMHFSWFSDPFFSFFFFFFFFLLGHDQSVWWDSFVSLFIMLNSHSQASTFMTILRSS